ncbi:Hpt domain-containing protein [Pararhodobacter sp. SW119]|uniref:Hpt domain-containing protein n=1 Tax=Pararhodobacter sp. SW119 TaxID=2780075 RepID=UPI001ADF1B72|nr:Hpt domain-containing protein [Pararhodobacter sp. SW119]
MINWPHVEELKAEMDEAFDEVVAMFLEEAGEVIARLRKSPEPARYQADLHFLKGAALNLGFDRFAEHCAEGEAQAAAGAPEDVELSKIISSYDDSVAELKKGLATRAA